MAYHISSGIISSRVTLYYDSMYISSGGVANSTAVNSGGKMYISSGGVANSTTVNSSGRMYIYSGGVANSTTVNSSGWMYISSGGVANSTTVNSSGSIFISSGGANSTTINSYGNMRISSGGTANSTTINSSGFMSILSGGTANSTTVNGYMFIDSGGTANSTTVNSWSWMTISGGTANDTTVNSSGVMRISSGGTANSTTVNFRGGMYISSGGTANSTTVNPWGWMTISGGTANDTTVSSGGTMTISGGTANDTTVSSGGDMRIYSGGVANSTTVNSWGWMTISSGGVANSTTVNSWGWMTISSGGVANSTTISGGSMTIYSGGTASIVFTPWQGTVYSSAGAVVEYLERDANVYYGGQSQGIVSKADSFTGLDITSGNSMFVYYGGVANSTTVNSGGRMHISSGGVANSTTVNFRGGMYISSGGTANSTTVNSGGCMYISSGGTANSTTVNSGGYMYIFSGGTANSTTITRGGEISILSGGTANIVFDPWQGTVYSSAGAVVEYLERDANVYYGGQSQGIVSKADSFTGLDITSGNSMFVYSGGAANSTIVNSGGGMYISSGGAASNTTVNANGVFLLSSGGSAVNLTLSRYASASITDAFISNLNMASRASAAVTNGLIGGVVINSSAALHCSASDRNHFMTLSGGTVYSNGKIIASSGAAVSNVTVSKAGTLHLENGGQAYATLIREEGIFTMLGVANSTTLHGGSMYVGDSSYQNYDGTGGNPTSNVYDEDIHASNNTLNSSWLHVYSGGTATNNVVNSNSWLHVYYGGTATSNVINSSGYITVQDSGTANTAFVHSGGFMRLYTGAILQGEVNVGGKVTVHTAGTSATEDVIRAYGAKIDYLVSERTVQDESIITNLGMIMGATFFATVKSDQTAGTYRLADGARDFDGNITIRNESGTVYGTLAVNGDDITHNGVTYSLDQADGNLTLTVNGGSAPGVSNLTGNANGVSWNGNGSAFVVEYSLNNFASVLQLETATSAVDTYQTPAGSWQVRVDSDVQTSFTAAAPTGSATQIVSDADGDLDVFFARTAGTWTSRNVARHTNSLNGWRGTNERVALTGKNIITDVFAGSTDANVLVLTDDTNGDALFLDDMYSALGNQARLSNIDEIRAGAGNDVIDLTSPKFAYLGDEMTVFGGAGDDTIWANSGENTLYGDAGNDRIIGGAGNDFIIGGAGNDALHGGGGSDTFCFGANWGTDTVEQLAAGKVILRFETGSMNNWNASTGVYSDGTNTVTVTGSGDIELYFGTASTLPEDAFAPAASEKIFEQLA